MERHALTVLLLFAALGFYALGFESGVFGAFVVGGAMELWFWVRLMRKPVSSPE